MSSPGRIQSAAGSQSIEDFVEALLASLPPIYEKEKKDTTLYKLYYALAEQLVKADIKLEQVANDNYLSVEVKDEIKIRGLGGKDRLENENAYDLINIRFRQTNSEVLQNIHLSEGENFVQLLFIPESEGFNVYDLDQSIPLDNFTFEYVENNVLKINSPRSGNYVLGYLETGDVIRLTENVVVPVGLFRLGYGEGGFSELGFGE